MSLVDYANRELDILGLGTNDLTGESLEYSLRENILRIIQEFSDEGHSGSSASYAIGIITKLLQFKPLTPLTGEDSEWNYSYDSEYYGKVYQNKRASSVFKDDRGAYWSDGIVFWEWYSSPDIDDGKPYKTYFTSKDSKVMIEEFPWTMPDKPEYREAKTTDD